MTSAVRRHCLNWIEKTEPQGDPCGSKSEKQDRRSREAASMSKAGLVVLLALPRVRAAKCNKTHENPSYIIWATVEYQKMTQRHGGIFISM